MNACYYTHCPSCGAVALETTLEKLRDELAQHIRAEHPDVYVSTRLLDHAMQEVVYYPGSQEPPRLAYYQYCPKCGGRLEAPTMDGLCEQFVKHYRDDHPSVYRGDLNDEKVRRLWATTTLLCEPARESKEPKATPSPKEPNVSTKPASTYVFTCPVCDDILREPTYEDLVKLVDKHAALPDHTFAESLSVVQDFCSYRPDELRTTLSGYVVASDPEVPEAPPVSYHYFKCPCCPHVTMESTYTKMHKVALEHINADHPEGSLDQTDALRALRGTTPFSTRRTSAEPVASMSKESYVATDDKGNTIPLDTTLPKDQWDLNGAVKPPIGIQPEHLWREHRMYELIACINRYHESGFPVKPEWLAELRSILVDSRFLSVLKETK